MLSKKVQKIILILAIFMVFSMTMVGAGAAVTGDGTENNPYQLTTVEELTNFLNNTLTGEYGILMGTSDAGPYITDNTLNVKGKKNLDLNGQVIIANTLTKSFSVIKVFSTADLTITDTTTVVHKFSVFNGLWKLNEKNGNEVVYGGVITRGVGKGAGGGIYVDGKLTLKGGNIVGNRANFASKVQPGLGGGICIASEDKQKGRDPTVIIDGGNIIGNIARNGAGVYVCNTGELTLDSGNIANNSAQSNQNNGGLGGGVFNSGDFTINNGTICNNKADLYGGGVFMNRVSENPGTFTILGGSITNNEAYLGGGVCMDFNYKESGTFTVGGTAQIKDNLGTKLIVSNLESNVLLPFGIKLAISKDQGLAEGASIGISTVGNGYPVIFSEPNSEDYSSYFSPDNGDSLNLVIPKSTQAENYQLKVDFNGTVKEVNDEDSLIAAAGSAEAGDIIQLTDNVSLSQGKSINIKEGVYFYPGEYTLTNNGEIVVNDLSSIINIAIENICAVGTGKITLGTDIVYPNSTNYILSIPQGTSMKVKRGEGTSTDPNIYDVSLSGKLYLGFADYLSLNIGNTINFGGNGSLEISSLSHPEKGIEVRGTVNLYVPTTLDAVCGSGNMNVYSKLTSTTISPALTVKYAPLKINGNGTILDYYGEEVDVYSLLCEKGTVWSIDGDTLWLGLSSYTLNPENGTKGSWVVNGTSGTVDNARIIEAKFVTPSTPSHSSTTFKSSVKSADGVFTFDRAVVVTEAKLPGATEAKITNSTGDGYYNFDLTAPGFTGNGTMYIQIPLSVIAQKGLTVYDVCLFHKENNEWVLKPTTYVKSDSQYAYYTATFDSCSPFKIDFKEGAAKGSSSSTVTEKQDTSKTTETTTKTDSSSTTTKTDTSSTTKKTEEKAKSPFPLFGVIAGLGIAAVFLKSRRH